MVMSLVCDQDTIYNMGGGGGGGLEQNVRKDRICFEVLDEGNKTEQQKIAVKYLASLDNTTNYCCFGVYSLCKDRKEGGSLIILM